MGTKTTGTIEIVTEKLNISYLDGEFHIQNRETLRTFVTNESDFYLLGKYIKAITSLVKEINVK